MIRVYFNDGTDFAIATDATFDYKDMTITGRRVSNNAMVIIPLASVKYVEEERE